jgi:hypothetical protein
LHSQISRVDLVAQLVEHNTFNVGALGSSPSGITRSNSKKLKAVQNLKSERLFCFLVLNFAQTCSKFL